MITFNILKTKKCSTHTVEVSNLTRNMKICYRIGDSHCRDCTRGNFSIMNSNFAVKKI